MDAKPIAVITGANGGIGTAICKQLHLSGYRVAALCRPSEKAKAWAEDMAAQELDLKVYHADIRDLDAVQTAMAVIEQELGPIAVLVNNAGITRDGTLRKMELKDWQDVVDTNLTGAFNLCRAVVPFMVDREYGRIINISSVNGEKGQLGQTNYAATKAGLHGLTMSLAQELARKGITVNTISPGYVATDMVMAVPAEIRAMIIKAIPVGRLGKPEEIARVVDFLADSQAGFITGSNISANGGQHMHY